jgi:hypothetical protein
MADMAAAVAAADAARRAAQRDEAAVLQAMAHVSQQHAEDQCMLKAVRALLAKAETRAKIAEGLVALMDDGINQERVYLMGLVRAAESKLSGAETQALTYKVAVKNMLREYDKVVDEVEVKFKNMKAKHRQQLEEVQQQAAADKAQLEGQVAQLRGRLGLVEDGVGDAAASPQPAAAVKQQGTKRRGLGLHLLWKTVR